MGKVRQLKDVSSPALLLLCYAKTVNLDDNSDWRRNSRFFSFSGKDERLFRQYKSTVAWDNEPDATDGRKDWCGMESLARVFRSRDIPVLLCVGVLRAGSV
jgi:hypothetical protein